MGVMLPSHLRYILKMEPKDVLIDWMRCVMERRVRQTPSLE